MESIGDAWGFSSKTPITPSRGFSVEILTGVTLSWKTKLNRSIPAMEDRIPGGLQHCPKTCCKKGGLVCLEVTSLQRCISGQVDLHMTRMVYEEVPRNL